MKVKVLNLVCTCVIFVFALHDALSIFPYLEKDTWEPIIDRALIIFVWFALGEAVSEGILYCRLKEINLEKKLRMSASLLLLLGWLATMAGSIRVGVELSRNWNVDNKNEFLAWNWARVAFWGLRLGIVVPLTFWVEKDYVKIKQEPVPPYDLSKDDNAFTIEDEFDDQLPNV